VGSVAASAGTAPLRTLLLGRLALRAGEVLYGPEQPVRQVYAVRSGSLRSLAVEAPNRVFAFHLPGELVGIDGLGSACHRAWVVAIEDSQLCAFRCGPGAGVGGAVGLLVGRLWDMASCELLRQRAPQAEGTASQRVAGLLASLAGRMRGRGYGSGEFKLRMGAADFASHLGLDIGDVEEALAQFTGSGWLEGCPGSLLVREPGALAEAAAAARSSARLPVEPRPREHVEVAHGVHRETSRPQHPGHDDGVERPGGDGGR
jgi:CRP/FNR family transcriptional regulator